MRHHDLTPSDCRALCAGIARVVSVVLQITMLRDWGATMRALYASD